jgi:hypothetical protein
MSNARWRVAAVVLVVALSLVGPAQAQSPGFDRNIGLRLNIVTGDGEPTNDIPGGGLFGHYRLNDRWWLGLALDHSPGFDVERPFEILGLASAAPDEEVDADGTMTTFLAWIERVYDRPGRMEWFWGVGGGGGTVDVDDLIGRRLGGGTYNIVNDVGTELLATASGGFRVDLGSLWAFEFALRLDQHFTDWTVTDRVSGRSATVDDYLLKGGHFGFLYRF